MHEREIGQSFYRLLEERNGGLIVALTIADPAERVLKLRLGVFTQSCRQHLCPIKAGLVGSVIGQQASEVVGNDYRVGVFLQQLVIFGNRAVIIASPLQNGGQSQGPT